MKRVLIVLTSHATLGDTEQPTGYYLCGVAQPYLVLEKTGYQVELASIKGGEPSVIKTSVNLKDPYNKRFLERADILSALRGTSRLADLRASSLITGQNPASAMGTAEAVVALLKTRNQVISA
jgi:putative intracellular protease/amidase